MKTEQEIEKQIMGINIDTGYRLPKAERMYSEEEVLELLKLREDYCDDLTKNYTIEIYNWFEKYKKK